MKKPLLIALLAACSALPFTLEGRAGTPVVVPGKYAIDSGHSQAVFRVKHSGVAWFYGRFNEVSGSVEVDDADPTRSSVELEIAVNSVDTGMEKLDRHLEVPATLVTSLCLGGPDRRDLYIVSADNTNDKALRGSIFRTRVEVPGVAVALARV